MLHLVPPSGRFYDGSCASFSPFCFLSVVMFPLSPLPYTPGFPWRLSVGLPGYHVHAHVVGSHAWELPVFAALGALLPSSRPTDQVA